jgi:hypothetical protein
MLQQVSLIGEMHRNEQVCEKERFHLVLGNFAAGDHRTVTKLDRNQTRQYNSYIFSVYCVEHQVVRNKLNNDAKRSWRECTIADIQRDRR